MEECRKWDTLLVSITHTQPFNGLLFGTYLVGRYQKKHSPTHTHPDHRASFIIFLHLQRSMASSLTVLLDNLSPGPLWSSPWPLTFHFILHAFLHPIIIIFSQHVPQRSLFCCNTNAMCLLIASFHSSYSTCIFCNSGA